MRHHRVAGVGLVLDQHLPIAVVHVAQHAARDLQPAGRRAVDHVVDARQAVAEEFLEARADVVELGEHEAAVVVDVLDRVHAVAGVALVELGVLVALGERNLPQRAVGAERPGVIRAAEELAGVAAGLGGDAGALVRAAVVQHPHRVVAVPDHQDRRGADGRAEIVALVGHLAVVADIDPGVGEQVLHLELEHLLVDIDVAMDLGLADQVADGLGVAAVSAHRHLLSRPAIILDFEAFARQRGGTCSGAVIVQHASNSRPCQPSASCFRLAAFR